MTELYKNITKKVTITDKEYLGSTCHKCNKVVDAEDTLGQQEMFITTMYNGFGSLFGDGSICELSLCKECAYELLLPYVKYIDHGPLDNPNTDNFTCAGFEDCPARWCENETPGCSDLKRKHPDKEIHDD